MEANKALIAAAHAMKQCKWVPEGSVAAGEWQSAPPTATSDRVCDDLTVCDLKNEYVIQENETT